MASINPMYSSLTTSRLTGLSSGMDTDTLIQSMMQIEKLKLNRELRSRTTLEWKQTALNTVTSDLKDFKQTYMSVLSAKNMYSASAYTSYTVNKFGTNTDAVTISAGANAKVDTMTIDKVLQLAKAASVKSNAAKDTAGLTADGAGFDPATTQLQDLALSTGLEFDYEGKVSFAINGEIFSFDQTDTVQHMMDTVSASEAARVTMSYNAETDKFNIQGTGETIIVNLSGNAFGTFGGTDGGAFGIKGKTYNSGDNITTNEPARFGVSRTGGLAPDNTVQLQNLTFQNSLGFVDGYISFSINGETFRFHEEDTLQHMLSTVSGNEKAGVVMNYSRLTDSFTISAKESGAGGRIVIQNGIGNAFGEEDSAFGIADGIYGGGQNAVMVVDGTRVERSSNSFSVDGITYTLNTTTDEAITFTLSKDIEPAVEKVKEFVNGYNTLLAKLNELLSEKKKSSEAGYVALTDEEKAGMTETQIEQWETIAKKGLLYNDAGIRNVVDSLRNALYTAVEGAGLSPSQIGLKTGNWTTKGQIELDENALRAALKKDSDQVMQVFCNDSDSDNASVAYKERGLLNRISEIFDQYISGSQASTLDSMSRTMTALEKKIERMEERLLEQEERYYLKFAAMETALAKLQQQTNSLTQMFSS